MTLFFFVNDYNQDNTGHYTTSLSEIVFAMLVEALPSLILIYNYEHLWKENV